MLGALLNFNEILLNVRTAYVKLDIMQERLLTGHFAWCWMLCGFFAETTGNFDQPYVSYVFCSVYCWIKCWGEFEDEKKSRYFRKWNPELFSPSSEVETKAKANLRKISKLSLSGSVCFFYNYWGWRAGGILDCGSIGIGAGSLCCKRLSNSGSTIHTIKQISVVEEKPFTLSCTVVTFLHIDLKKIF